jgi:DNA ligase-1
MSYPDKPMLAFKAKTVTDARLPVITSPKLDGIRARVLNGKLLSRSMKPIPNRPTNERFANKELDGFDGELICGSPVAPDCFRVSSSATSHETRKSDVKFYVFDDCSVDAPFKQRLVRLHERVRLLKHPHIVLVDQTTVSTHSALRVYEAKALELGFEGICWRSPTGRYKAGRSTLDEHYLIALKQFVDAEAEIISVIEELENTNVAMRNELGHTHRSSAKAGMRPKGTAGALEVRDLESGIVFNIGSGIDEQTGLWLWRNRAKLSGAVIKYKSFKIGVKDKPRHPVFLGLRERWDMSK